ncbi:MAG TPA: glycosyltransferase family 4 protein [Patescibacteria group bacterium]|nr:glycosyltransferase family 4 protein [Patescibacteria group bacterium]
MRAAIYNPYLDTLGGGERYTASFAKVLADSGWSVDIEWPDREIKESLQKRFGIDLKGVEVVKDINRGDGYDLCFWVSDGSIPTLKSRKNFLHFQVPFHGVGGNNLLNKMKLFRIDKIICNSEFTKKIIDREYGVESSVIYPPVDIEHIKSKRKENLILFVGRFSQLKQSKNQDVLVKSFKKLFDSGLNDWKLVLAGGIEVGVTDYLNSLEKMSEGYPIQIIKSPDFSNLKDLYGKARIFWSASGYDENEEKNPEKVEHFGITVVEAMAASAIPVVFNAGGHKEIITEGVDGLLWNKQSELVKKTRNIIDDKILYSKIKKDLSETSQKFSYNRFKENVLLILQ